MRTVGVKFKNIIKLAGLIGLPRLLAHVAYWSLTSPKIWEPLLVKKYYGRKIISKVIGLDEYVSDKLVSVVLPVNNGRSKGVERLVESLKNQTHKNIEFIAIDSGSTDDTVSWLRSNNFKVIEIEPASFTHAFSRNTGAEQAQGDYLLFVVDDVVFRDFDWIRTAIFLLECFGADSLSSRQTVDDGANVYARVLDAFLSGSQSERPSLNVSKSGLIVNSVRKILPLRSVFRSVSIDDTNHLVKKESFDKIKFKTSTVEDIDFALRLTREGMKTIYTNLIAVVHYHDYKIDNLKNYAKRVCLDMRIIKNWQPNYIKFDFRDSFIVASVHVLSQILHALVLMEEYCKNVNSYTRRHCNPELMDKADLNKFIELYDKVDFNSLHSLKYRYNKFYDESVRLFTTVMGGGPPSNLYYHRRLAEYFHIHLKRDIQRSGEILLRIDGDYMVIGDLKSLAVLLWCNRLMSYLARDKFFRSMEKRYESDSWVTKDWA